jgi:hypothetical protein
MHAERYVSIVKAKSSIIIISAPSSGLVRDVLRVPGNKGDVVVKLAT